MREARNQEAPDGLNIPFPSTPEAWVSPEAASPAPATPYTPRTIQWADEAGAPLTESTTTPRWIHPDDATSPSPPPPNPEPEGAAAEARQDEEGFEAAQAAVEAKARRDAWRAEYNERLKREHQDKMKGGAGARPGQGGAGIDVGIAVAMADDAQVTLC